MCAFAVVATTDAFMVYQVGFTTFIADASAFTFALFVAELAISDFTV